MRTFNLNLAVLVFLLAGNASIGIAQLLGTFTPTGDMSVPRAFHTATLLANGKVLIVGGVGITRSGDTQPLMTAELYDPYTRTFTPTGNMTTPRVRPSATLLNDGRVLIVGNEYKFNENLRNTADLYDPSTGTFTKTGDSVTNQTGGQAVLLNDGKVLIVGGWKAGTSSQPIQISNPELYNPLSGTFAATGPFATTGSTFYVAGGPDISAVSLLADGRVLIAGEPTSELYDPITNSFRLTSSMTTPCFMNAGQPTYIAGRAAILLTTGKVLLTGGEHEDCGRFANSELYDPVTEKFTSTADMSRQRDNHAATLLPDGSVLISGGESSDCPPTLIGCISYFSGTTATAESYDPSTATFSALGNMTARRAGHTSTVLMDGTVLLTGGYGYAGIGAYLGNFSSAEIYSPPVPLPTPVVTDLRFDRTTVGVGEFFAADFGGSNMTPEMFFDVRFTAPGSTFSYVSFNWQKGPKSNHLVSAGIAPGLWTINGVRAHRFEGDHTGNFLPVTAAIAIGK